MPSRLLVYNPKLFSFLILACNDWETKRVPSVSNEFESQSPCLIDVDRLICTYVREILSFLIQVYHIVGDVSKNVRG